MQSSADLSTYAKVSNTDYRLMKSLTPGPYTFLLKATSVVPRRLMNPRRKTIGVKEIEAVVAKTSIHRYIQPPEFFAIDK